MMWARFILGTGILCIWGAAGASADFLRSDSLLLADSPTEPADTDSYWNLAWHGRVASYGDPDSQFFVAQVYEQGKLVPRNMSKAIEFYQKAAEQGHVESCMHLAAILPEEAEQWYLKAANQNDPQAQLKLSKLYEENGDIPNAVFWLETALGFLFPNTDDLTRVSPDLARLRALL